MTVFTVQIQKAISGDFDAITQLTKDIAEIAMNKSSSGNNRLNNLFEEIEKLYLQAKKLQESEKSQKIDDSFIIFFNFMRLRYRLACDERLFRDTETHLNEQCDEVQKRLHEKLESQQNDLIKLENKFEQSQNELDNVTNLWTDEVSEKNKNAKLYEENILHYKERLQHSYDFNEELHRVIGKNQHQIEESNQRIEELLRVCDSLDEVVHDLGQKNQILAADTHHVLTSFHKLKEAYESANERIKNLDQANKIAIERIKTLNEIIQVQNKETEIVKELNNSLEKKVDEQQKELEAKNDKIEKLTHHNLELYSRNKFTNVTLDIVRIELNGTKKQLSDTEKRLNTLEATPVSILKVLVEQKKKLNAQILEKPVQESLVADTSKSTYSILNILPWRSSSASSSSSSTKLPAEDKDPIEIRTLSEALVHINLLTAQLVVSQQKLAKTQKQLSAKEAEISQTVEQCEIVRMYRTLPVYGNRTSDILEELKKEFKKTKHTTRPAYEAVQEHKEMRDKAETFAEVHVDLKNSVTEHANNIAEVYKTEELKSRNEKADLHKELKTKLRK